MLRASIENANLEFSEKEIESEMMNLHGSSMLKELESAVKLLAKKGVNYLINNLHPPELAKKSQLKREEEEAERTSYKKFFVLALAGATARCVKSRYLKSCREEDACFDYQDSQAAWLPFVGKAGIGGKG